MSTLVHPHLFGRPLPIVQAPMAGGACTPELVAAVSAAGGLGSVAAAVLPPAEIARQVARVRELTREPFAANLFVLPSRIEPDADEVARAWAALAPARAAVGLPEGERPPARFAESFDAQFDALCEAAPPVASFTLGILAADQVARLHARGCRVVGTATNVEEALAWEAAGADAVCAQGMEAGGHRGTFIGEQRDSFIGLMALLPQVVDAVRIPVLAAGGLMDGRGVAAVLALGASAAQVGTAYLDCRESGIADCWKAAVRGATPTQSVLTRAFSGRYARGQRNAFIRDHAPLESAAPAYPVQNALTGSMRKAATQAGNADYLSLWCGQGAAMSRRRPAGIGAGELTRRLADEAGAAVARLVPSTVAASPSPGPTPASPLPLTPHREHPDSAGDPRAGHRDASPNPGRRT